MKTGWLAAAAIAAPVATGAAFAAPALGVTTGLEISAGDYGGADDTQIVATPISVRLADGPWTFRAAISYLSIEGNGDDDVGVGQGAREGFGDLGLSLTRTFRRKDGLYAAATARAQLPTGDRDKGLSVGVVDYALTGEVGLSSPVGGLSLSGGRRFLGNSAEAARESGWQGGAGAWINLDRRARLALGYSWRNASLRPRSDPAEATASLTVRINADVRVALNVGAGLSDGSPEQRVGVRFTWD